MGFVNASTHPTGNGRSDIVGESINKMIDGIIAKYKELLALPGKRWMLFFTRLNEAGLNDGHHHGGREMNNVFDGVSIGSV